MTTTYTKRLALSTAILAACAAGSARAEDVDLHRALAPCARIANSADRVACYDKLAGRVSAAKAPPSSPAAVAAPVAAAPAAQPTARAATPTAAAAPAPTEEDFGRSNVQKAAISGSPHKIESVTAKVLGFGRSPNLHTQVTLDNGQIWEYEDAPDRLLSIGDSVTVKRASLGSFLLVTPTKLSHRVQRIN
jgi:hypothetical protein